MKKNNKGRLICVNTFLLNSLLPDVGKPWRKLNKLTRNSCSCLIAMFQKFFFANVLTVFLLWSMKLINLICFWMKEENSTLIKIVIYSPPIIKKYKKNSRMLYYERYHYYLNEADFGKAQRNLQRNKLQEDIENCLLSKICWASWCRKDFTAHRQCDRWGRVDSITSRITAKRVTYCSSFMGTFLWGGSA